MKRIITSILLLTMLVVCLCSCSNPKLSLADYVTNYDEVMTIIQDEFGTEKLTYKNNTRQSEEATLSQFGNGTYAILVNEVGVTVSCQDHIAVRVTIKKGTSSFDVKITPSGQELLNKSIINNTSVNNDTTETISGGFSGYHPDAPVETVGTTADIPVVDGQ